MNRIATTILLVMLCAMASVAAGFGNETLTYKVEYKWGLVQKTAGYVKIKLTNRNDRYVSTLTAASAKWADAFYKVRDTLHTEIIKEGFKPVLYIKDSHEGGDDKHDEVRFSYQGRKVIGNCVRKKWKDGKLEKDETRVLEAEGTTVDMLSAFYYMRDLPYSTWQKGHVHNINIFSGKRQELLTIRYHGREVVTVDDKKYDCYHITFIFTSDGKKKTSDDMDAWISTSGAHIPVKLEGKLPIGKVRCFYTGK